MTKFVLDKIKKKARWVARHYSEFRVDDLIQDGVQLALELEQKLGNRATIPYILRSVQNHFGTLVRDSNAIKKIKFVDLEHVSHVPAPDDFMGVENAIDRTRFMKALNDPNLASVIQDLIDGYGIQEIAIKRKTSTRSVYRQLRLLRKLRENWDK